jgi:hypothetical protein
MLRSLIASRVVRRKGPGAPARGGIGVRRPRFVFLSACSTGELGVPAKPGEGVIWLLMAPNNRRLGRSWEVFATYGQCRAAVGVLQREYRRVESQTIADNATGRFSWRVGLDGADLAVSSRAYLRNRECEYNLSRFLESVPQAMLVNGTRAVRSVLLAGQ